MSASSPPPSRYDLCGAAHDYPEWTGPPRRSVLICTHPRSGSTMLGEALYFAGGFGSPLEYIHAGSRGGFERRWNVSGLRTLIYEARRWRTDLGGTFAAKLFWRDIADLVDEIAPTDFPDLRTTPAMQVSPKTYRALAGLLHDLFPNPVYIHLERHDRLRQAISGITAAQTGAWRHIPNVEQTTEGESVTYDFDRICALIASSAFCHAHWYGFFSANGIDDHAVVYEELVADYALTIKRLLRGLGHVGEVPAVRMERQSTAATEILMRRFLADQRAMLSRRTSA